VFRSPMAGSFSGASSFPEDNWGRGASPRRARNRRPSPRGRRCHHPLRFPRGPSGRRAGPRHVRGRRPSPRGLQCRPQPLPRGHNRRPSPLGLQYRPPQRPTLTVSTASSRPKSPT
jgi:hypothetical protein